jgi:malonyl-CoA O-methyltransferase
MDYDATTIAATYDAARSYARHALGRWLDRIAAHAPTRPEAILEIGYGTGRFTHPPAERFRARVIGIDPSDTILKAARSKRSQGPIEVRRAPAKQLPMDGSVDLVFMSMVLHHPADPPRAARQYQRVLRATGRLVVRNLTRDGLDPQARTLRGFAAILESELERWQWLRHQASRKLS